ncbi:periplasmic sensor signal transduction histidine kinase [Chondrocystis sp. NIES-4102]|nr:periplasmic sensor signal transduction histidine kinase [Chondrocystis sp. NIES-4102]
MFNRSRSKLTRWFTFSMGGILIIFAAILYYVETLEEVEKLDRLLYRKTRVMATNVKYELITKTVNLENVPLLGNNTRIFDTEITYARWYNSQKQLKQFFGSPGTELLTVNHDLETIKSSLPWIRQITLPVYEKQVPIGYLQVGIPLTSTQQNLAELRLVLAITVPISLGFIGYTGWILAGIAMQPIHQAYNKLQRFTADASHELRAPLAAILTNAQVGLITPVKDGSGQLLRLEKITQLVESISILVSNLLLLDRYEGKLNPQSLQKLDLTYLLQQIADDYEFLAQEQGLEIIYDFPSQSLPIVAEPSLLTQAITNLLNNALKYTATGGRIKLFLARKSQQAIIKIADNGIGIPDADLPHIFERFYRVNSDRSRDSGSFGLGLAIVQQIIEAHGGEITVASELGVGTIFTIKLPV